MCWAPFHYIQQFKMFSFFLCIQFYPCYNFLLWHFFHSFHLSPITLLSNTSRIKRNFILLLLLEKKHLITFNWLIDWSLFLVIIFLVKWKKRKKSIATGVTQMNEWMKSLSMWYMGSCESMIDWIELNEWMKHWS